ncbi:FAD-binding oxidoreductase [Hymenobacter sp. B81]|uniref:FAD-binding oxidoreductase n=1 Tax=Hymenobacter sp. B81 TaxID=3344878 RepID=UPI0037DC3C2A
MLTEELIAEPRLSVRGRIIRQQDADYDTARKVYNGMIDKHPALIVQCVDVADVIEAVNFARDNDVLVAIRGGGHSGAGMAICDGGMVIDLSLMRRVYVDPAARTALVDGGCLLGDIDHATHAFGLALPSGIISSTGIGGITLGGGLGHLSRRYGLTIDHLLEADVVLADGRYVKASASQNSDLFWALRGGGGNFGVVTSFRFRLEQVSTVYGGPMLWHPQDTATVLRWYRRFIQTAPESINGFFAFLSVPPGPPFPEALHGHTMCGIVWNYVGPPAEAEQTFEDLLRELPPPALSLVGPLPLPALQSMFDALYVSGLHRWYWKTDFFRELNDEAIDAHLRFGLHLPSPSSTMHLYPINGKVAQVPSDATAWGFRDMTWAMVIVGVDPDARNDELLTAWARDYWAALHPHAAGGGYVNFMMDEGPERVKTTYGANYERLVSIKNKYDPDNLFRVNQNIRPTKHGHVLT